MHATVRRYEGIDKVRWEEITRKVVDSFVPDISRLTGFVGYFLIDAGAGVLTSVSLFETSAQSDASTRLAADWIREHDLASALPNAPQITAGPLVALAPDADAPQSRPTRPLTNGEVQREPRRGDPDHSTSEHPGSTSR